MQLRLDCAGPKVICDDLLQNVAERPACATWQSAFSGAPDWTAPEAGTLASGAKPIHAYEFQSFVGAPPLAVPSRRADPVLDATSRSAAVSPQLGFFLRGTIVTVEGCTFRAR